MVAAKVSCSGERELARCKEGEFDTPQGGFNEVIGGENCGLDTACQRDKNYKGGD